MLRYTLPLLVLTGCSSYNLMKSDEAGAFADTGYASTASDGVDEGGADAPPEEEDDFLKLAPAATDAYVFVANPERDTVTRISVPSLAVITTEVGDNPTAVETTADYARAVTLNEGDDSITIITAESLATVEVEIRDNFNRLSLSPTGRWAAAWYDPDKESVASSGGVQSFNELSLVNLDTATHLPMAVGFNPGNIRWSEDGRLLVVVSDGSLAVVDLTVDVPVPAMVELADDPLDAPAAEEVELSPGGEYAFIRQYGADEILVADLADLTLDRVTVGANPTDLDLSPDGLSLSVVARTAGQIWTLDATNPFAAPTVVDLPADSVYGSILFAGSGEKAVLYTTASPVAGYAIWDVATGEIVERRLEKPVSVMAVNPTGDSLLVFHTQDDAPDADPGSPFYGEWALTQIDLDDYRSNPLLLPAEPSGYSVSDDGKYGFFIMDGQPYVETLYFDTLLYDEEKLSSTPVYVGTLPNTDIAFVSQEHDLGRISFYDAQDDALDTITGFELNAQIEHE